MSRPPESEMAASGMPGRGLLFARPVITDDGPAIEMACDCALTTIVRIDIEGALAEPREIAVTCDGCGTAHWLTLSPEVSL